MKIFVWQWMLRLLRAIKNAEIVYSVDKYPPFYTYNYGFNVIMLQTVYGLLQAHFLYFFWQANLRGCGWSIAQDLISWLYYLMNSESWNTETKNYAFYVRWPY